MPFEFVYFIKNILKILKHSRNIKKIKKLNLFFFFSSVFTSTVNVRFNKTPIHLGTEDDVEEKDITEFIDEYSRSKYQAERIVLAGQNDFLQTTCLR